MSYLKTALPATSPRMDYPAPREPRSSTAGLAATTCPAAICCCASATGAEPQVGVVELLSDRQPRGSLDPRGVVPRGLLSHEGHDRGVLHDLHVGLVPE